MSLLKILFGTKDKQDCCSVIIETVSEEKGCCNIQLEEVKENKQDKQ